MRKSMGTRRGRRELRPDPSVEAACYGSCTADGWQHFVTFSRTFQVHLLSKISLLRPLARTLPVKAMSREQIYIAFETMKQTIMYEQNYIQYNHAATRHAAVGGGFVWPKAPAKLRVPMTAPHA